jgi:leucyl aminopeptidase
MILGMYEFSRYKKATSKPGDISEVSLLVSPSRVNETHSGIVRGQQLSDAVSYARDLVNESPSVTTPSYLAREAERIGKYSPNISVTVYGKEQIKTLGMGGLLGVSQGSDQEPKFIRMDYGTRSNPDLVLIGKGITFDTGGLSLKPSSGMETMKLDMAGAASILGVFAFLATAKPKLSVTGLIAASENMPSGSALKPGDIIRIMNGTTVEVLNTDAEGRLILADALSYAEKHLTPKTIIDIATLTGACMVALGEDVAGVFSNSDELHQELKNASVEAGELMWPLPLVGEYSIQLKSHVADLKNISKSKYGGAVTAALFLREFVSGRTRWAHIDIAGPAYAEKDSPFRPEGGTGYATATLIEYILARSGR